MFFLLVACMFISVAVTRTKTFLWKSFFVPITVSQIHIENMAFVLFLFSISGAVVSKYDYCNIEEQVLIRTTRILRSIVNISILLKIVTILLSLSISYMFQRISTHYIMQIYVYDNICTFIWDFPSKLFCSSFGTLAIELFDDRWQPVTCVPF